MNYINEDTVIPISLVLLLLGGVAAFTHTEGVVSANSQRIQELKDDQKNYSDKIDKVLQKLGKIEGKLGID